MDGGQRRLQKGVGTVSATVRARLVVLEGDEVPSVPTRALSFSWDWLLKGQERGSRRSLASWGCRPNGLSTGNERPGRLTGPDRWPKPAPCGS